MFGPQPIIFWSDRAVSSMENARPLCGDGPPPGDAADSWLPEASESEASPCLEVAEAATAPEDEWASLFGEATAPANAVAEAERGQDEEAAPSQWQEQGPFHADAPNGTAPSMGGAASTAGPIEVETPSAQHLYKTALCELTAEVRALRGVRPDAEDLALQPLGDSDDESAASDDDDAGAAGVPWSQPESQMSEIGVDPAEAVEANNRALVQQLRSDRGFGVLDVALAAASTAAAAASEDSDIFDKAARRVVEDLLNLGRAKVVSDLAEAQRLEVDRKTLRKSRNRFASAAVLLQHTAAQKMIKSVLAAVRSRRGRAVLLSEHVRYDETPMVSRLRDSNLVYSFSSSLEDTDGPATQGLCLIPAADMKASAKNLLSTEYKYMMLFRCGQTFLAIHWELLVPVQALGRNNGEGYSKALALTGLDLEPFAKDFERVQRAVATWGWSSRPGRASYLAIQAGLAPLALEVSSPHGRGHEGERVELVHDGVPCQVGRA